MEETWGSGQTEGSDSTKDQILETISKIETMLKETEVFYKKLTEGDPESASIKAEIEKAQSEAVEQSTEISEKLEETKSKLKDLEKLHLIVFGEKNGDETTAVGLKAELDDRKKELEDLEKEYSKQFDSLFEQIEGLLPGATSAGLATAYNKLCGDATKREWRYSVAFYFGVAALTVSAALTITQSFSLQPLSWNLISIANAGEYLNKVLFKLPIVIPVLWFTLTVSKRRSEMHRLAEEYAHKEALAKSYQGFKEQITELGKENDPLLDQLLKAILEAIAVNSAKTLEGKHGEKMPVQQVLEETIIKAIDKSKPPI